MKKLILTLSFSLCLWQVQSYAQSSYGPTSITYIGEDNKAIQDLKNTLRPYRIGNISIQKVSLGSRTGQEFYLGINGSNTEIKYTTQNSLENAVYTLLDILGFHWYGPSGNWFIKPSNIVLPQMAGTWISPTFRNRTFFGTGGLNFGKAQPYDPKNEVKAKWSDWMRRNRFNTDFGAVGHQGQAFYAQNKGLLSKHPEWFTNSKGMERGRIKIDNPNAVNAFKTWVRSTYNKKINTNEFITLGVDPADGRGGADDPLPKNMKGINNHADKWWWLANQVAQDYINNKNVVVTMYAYGDGDQNARVPDFKLLPNVYPVIIPYAFQKAYLPNEMVTKWANSVTSNMGIYDYWNITQWSVGAPQFNIYNMVPKLQFWSENKINGIYLESTNGTGPMGHALWLAGQLQWNLTQDFDSLYHQYLVDCFGRGAPYMKNMFDRWSKNYQGAADVPFSLQDLNNASNAVTKGSPEWKRINELKAYAHYLKLYYEHDGTQKSKDNIFNYLYSIHHLMLVQTAAFIGQKYIKPFDKGNIVPSGNKIKPLSDQDIDKQFQKDLVSSAPKYSISNFIFKLDDVVYTKPIPEKSWRFGGYQLKFYFKAPFTGKLSMDIGAQSKTPFRFYTNEKVLIDESVGKENFDYKETLDRKTWYMKKFSVDIIKGETYNITTSYGFSRGKINIPGIVLFKHPGSQDFDNYQYPSQYFYVPKDATEIAFYDGQKEGTNGKGYLITPDGKKLSRASTGEKNVYKVPVAPQYRGKIWVASFGHPSWKFLNIPNIASLQEFEYKE